MKIFFDTNIILDVLLEREPFYKNSAFLWTLAENEKLKIYISAISVNNIFYIVKKYKGQESAEKVVDIIIDTFTIIPLDYEILKLARTKEQKDYEDLIQYFSAIKSGTKYIITRNKKDFPSDVLKILNSDEFVSLYFQK